MRAVLRTGGVPTPRRSRFLVFIAAIALVCGCDAATLTPGPGATLVDSQDPGVTSSVPPTVAPDIEPTPTVAATPGATAKPPRPGPRWEQAKLPRWVETGKPVLLADGRVLVIGAEKGTAAIWNPATGKWKATGSLNKPRTDFAAIRLGDGRMLVAGGQNAAHQSFSSAYTWDPRTGTWTKVGLMAQARTAPSIAALPDGRILVAGGYFAIEPDWGMATPETGARLALAHPNEAGTAMLAVLVPPFADMEAPPAGRGLATAEIFDPTTGEWSETRPMHYARGGAEAVTLADGRVLVAGSLGYELGFDEQACSTAEIYDPATGRWSVAGNGSEWAGNQDTGTLVALDDGGAVLIGVSWWSKHDSEGTDSRRFDARTGAWRKIGRAWSMDLGNSSGSRAHTTPGPRWLDATVVKLADGRILVAGGDGNGMETGRPTSRVARLYDPASDTWAKLPKLPSARAGGQGALLTDGTVLIIGGYLDAPTGWGGKAVRTIVRFVPGP